LSRSTPPRPSRYRALLIWVKETYQEQGGSQPTKIVGAPYSGAVVYTAEATVDGLKGTMITVTTTSVTEAANYRHEPSYS